MEWELYTPLKADGDDLQEYLTLSLHVPSTPWIKDLKLSQWDLVAPINVASFLEALPTNEGAEPVRIWYDGVHWNVDHTEVCNPEQAVDLSEGGLFPARFDTPWTFRTDLLHIFPTNAEVFVWKFTADDRVTVNDQVIPEGTIETQKKEPLSIAHRVAPVAKLAQCFHQDKAFFKIFFLSKDWVMFFLDDDRHTKGALVLRAGQAKAMNEVDLSVD